MLRNKTKRSKVTYVALLVQAMARPPENTLYHVSLIVTTEGARSRGPFPANDVRAPRMP